MTVIQQRRSTLHLDQQLCTSVWHNDLRASTLYLHQGANPTVPCHRQTIYDPYYPRQCSALFYAGHSLSLPLLSMLLNYTTTPIQHHTDNQGMTLLHYMVDPYVTMLHVSKCLLRGHRTNCTTLSSSPAMDAASTLLIQRMTDPQEIAADRRHDVDRQTGGTGVTVPCAVFVSAWETMAMPAVQLVLDHDDRFNHGRCLDNHSSGATNCGAVWLDPVDSFGQTVLHRAAESGVLGVVAVVFRRTHGINARDLAGQTPLDRAWARSHREIAAWLVDRGAVRGGSGSGGGGGDSSGGEMQDHRTVPPSSTTPFLRQYTPTPRPTEGMPKLTGSLPQHPVLQHHHDYFHMLQPAWTKKK